MQSQRAFTSPSPTPNSIARKLVINHKNSIIEVPEKKNMLSGQNLPNDGKSFSKKYNPIRPTF